jgi:hypothetical protein
MKTLSTDAAAAALDVDRKTLDNILAREARHLVRAGRRGRSRRIPIRALELIALALVLSRDVGITIARGLEVAEKILSVPSAQVALGSLTTLAFDVSRLRIALEQSISDALESVAEPTRGRPRR